MRVLNDNNAPIDALVQAEFIHQGQQCRVTGQTLHGVVHWDNTPPPGIALEVLVHPMEPGYWTVHTHCASDATVQLPVLNGTPWWLALVGLKSPGGSRIRLGIVDTEWHSDDGLAHATLIDERGRRVAPRRMIGRPHGELVARVVADRSPQGSSCSAAPLVQLTHVSMGATVDHNRAVQGIIRLAKLGADIISMSFGAHTQTAPQNLRNAIEYARRRGAVCIAAAGNDPARGVAWPASLPDVIAVGAIGETSMCGPAITAAYRVALAANTRVQYNGSQVFYSPVSARGVDVVAPGVGIVVSVCGQPAQDVIGTSFAAPLCAGVLANALSSDSRYFSKSGVRRAEYAERVLRGLCVPTGLPPALEGHGMPVLPDLAQLHTPNPDAVIT